MDENFNVVSQKNNDLFFIENEKSIEEKSVKMKVKNFIVSELNNDEIEFDEKIYSKIFSEFSQIINTEKTYDRNYFIHHENQELRETVNDMLLSQYELSDWGKVGIVVPTEEVVLRHQVLSAVYMLKTRKVMSLIKENQEEIKKRVEANEEWMELLERHKMLEEVKQQLTKYLGIVVVK